MATTTNNTGVRWLLLIPMDTSSHCLSVCMVMIVSVIKYKYFNNDYVLDKAPTSRGKLTSAFAAVRYSTTRRWPFWEATNKGVPPSWRLRTFQWQHHNNTAIHTHVAIHLRWVKAGSGYGQALLRLLTTEFMVYFESMKCSSDFCFASCYYVADNVNKQIGFHGNTPTLS